MKFRHVTAAMVAAALVGSPASRVHADEFVGGLVGGLIGGAIGSGLANQANKNRQRNQTQTQTKTRTRTVYVNPAQTAQRAENRQVQTSLNYFGFNAGGADGVLGGRSRAAISSYQVYLGYPATGSLTEYEKQTLLAAYNRSIAGGPEVSRIIAKSRDGVRGMLVAQRDGTVGSPNAGTGYAGLPAPVSEAVDEVANSSDPSAEQLLQRSGFIQLADLNGDGNTDYIIDTGLAGSSFWCNASACKTMVFASTATGYTRNDLLVHSPTAESFDCIGGTCQVKLTPSQVPQPQTQLAAAETAQPVTETAGLSVPVFTTAPKRKSLSNYCSKVNLLTSSNGGYTTVSSMSDPSFTLSEQFCLARTYTIAAGEDLIASVQGATPDQIAAQCDGFGKGMSEYIAKLASAPAVAVLNDFTNVVLNSGTTPDQLRTTSKICLASGYQTDNMNTALGSAMMMSALGERSFAELVAHHLQGGFGAAQSTEMAITWYEMALEALDSGASPAFAPDQADRVDLLRQATLRLSDGGAAVPQPAAAGDGTVPVFTLAE